MIDLSVISHINIIICHRSHRKAKENKLYMRAMHKTAVNWWKLNDQHKALHVIDCTCNFCANQSKGHIVKRQAHLWMCVCAGGNFHCDFVCSFTDLVFAFCFSFVKSQFFFLCANHLFTSYNHIIWFSRRKNEWEHIFDHNKCAVQMKWSDERARLRVRSFMCVRASGANIAISFSFDITCLWFLKRFSHKNTV